MWGTTSKKNDPKVGTLVCSSPAVCPPTGKVREQAWLTCNSLQKCINIQAHNITVSPPSGKGAQWECSNLDTSKLQIKCMKS